MSSLPEIACPRCGAKRPVPSESAPAPLRCLECGDVIFSSGTAAEKEADEYELWNGDTPQPSQSESWAYGPFLPIACRVCGTRIVARPEQVGSDVTCPDCHAKTLVTAAAIDPTKMAPPPAMAEDDDPYELVDESPGARPESYPDLFSFPCPHCSSLLYASPEQAGTEIMCPDCRRPRRAPPAPRRDKQASPQDEGPPMEVASPVAEPDAERAPAHEPPPATVRYGDASEVERLPAGSLVAGLTSFAADGSVALYWIALAVTGALVAVVVQAGWNMASQASIVAVMGVFLLVVGAIVVPIWFSWFAACMITVVVDSSFGFRRINRWPEGNFTDWIGEALFVASSLIVGFGPGVALSQLLHLEGAASVALVTLSAWLIWPVTTVSMLEAGSPLKPFVPDVVRGIEAQPLVWLRYYAISAGLFAAGGIAIAPRMLTPAVATPILLAITLIVFRLLGLVAWACNDIDLGGDHETTSDEEPDVEST